MVLPWIDQKWIAACGEVDGSVPDWLTVGRGASFGYWLERSDSVGEGWEAVSAAVLNEVSVLSPGRKPHEPSAQVLTITKRKPAAAPENQVALCNLIAPRPERVERRHDDEMAELNRRIDFAIARNPNADVEAIIVGYQSELGYSPWWQKVAA